MPGLVLSPLPEPTAPNAPKRTLAPEFGRVATGVDLANLSPEELDQIQKALYTHSVLIFPRTKLSPEKQYELTKSFDPESESYGHGAGRQKNSILHPDLKTIPRVPQVQLIGNGPVSAHEGLQNVQLKHPHHKTFHKTKVSDEDEEKGFTRFYRWHIDAALYDRSPPRVTTLYGLEVPKGRAQVLRYDDGTGDELPVPLGTTAFISGAQLFDSLSPSQKSLAVRTKVRYAPHPYVWMSSASAKPTGLGLEDEGREMGLDELPPWAEEKVKVLPMLWKNPQTGKLHFQVHPSAIHQLIIDPVQAGGEAGLSESDQLYPSGAHVTDLAQARKIVYDLQRPGIAPERVYAHDWEAGDMCLFHNQGVLHSVVGAFRPDEVRMFHQCNLAASADPLPPSVEDIKKYT